MRYFVSAFFAFLFFIGTRAQVVINEASTRNYTQIYDDEGETHDWFELFNAGATGVSLAGYGITDNADIIGKWTFPDYILGAGQFVVVFASGLDIADVVLVDHWESAVLPANVFKYLEPDASTPANWYMPGFDDSSWAEGTAGFGYGDDDDNTVTNASIPSVYIRHEFGIADTSVLSGAVLHVDYDDGFIAYLNGVEIARSNISGTPSWNTPADGNHEAAMYLGGNPESFILDMALIRDIWVEGNNVLAIEGHNVDLSSTDFSLIPFLSFGIRTGDSYFQDVPGWFPKNSGKFMHTGFKLDPDGETLVLSSPGGAVLDSLPVPRIPLNTSYGRVTDGASEAGIFTEATPGESNNTSQAYTHGTETAPVFSVQAGFYSSTVQVALSTTSPTAQIRYTTDGSVPTSYSSLYNGSVINISSTKTLKAKCFSTTDKLPGPVVAATYFINVEHDVPVISISTNTENLYGSTGIFDNTDQDWNKSCYIEYFDENKELIFQQEAGIQIDGGAGGSRTHPQHSVRIEPGNGTLGDGDVNYAMIPDRPNREDYSSFYLRNGSNQYYTLPFKDGVQVKSIAKNTYTYYSGYSVIVAYINGQYFGLYELREKLNADLFKESYLMDIDSLDLLTLSYYKGSVLEALEGSVEPFWDNWEYFQTLSPGAADYLVRVDSILDLENYTDYMIAQSWIGNTDWPFNNIRALRCSGTNFRWQFAVQDVEWAMQPNGWSSSDFDHIGFLFDQGRNFPYNGFWYNLIQNEEYKIGYINRFADLMNKNYLFSVIGDKEEEIYDYQLPEMPAEFARWGNLTMSTYNANHEIFRNELYDRTSHVREHMMSHFDLDRQVNVILDVQPEGAGQIMISTITPVNYPWKGVYFSDNPVKITALPNPGYKFSSWSNNSFITDPLNPECLLDLSGAPDSFMANFEASNDNFQGVTISEIHYKNGTNENSTDWIELYNGSDSPVSLNGWYFTDSESDHIFRFSSMAQIDSNSRLVIVRNIDDFVAMYPDVSNFTGPFNFGLGTPTDAVKLYDNTDHLVAEVNYADIYPWPLGGLENGKTLELRNPAGDLNDPANWFAGCIGGSPGTPYIACQSGDGVDQPTIRDNSLTMFPNPASDFVNLNFTLKKEYRNSTLKVYDLIGTQVYSKTIPSLASGRTTLPVDLSGMPDGLLILVFEAEGIREVRKLEHVR
ncbi:MAG: lamin tail domain-containing protein [Bacteroidales bacterium]|nr:lamin tail domain-containing protein [Bacteroidales bacterium]